MKLFLVLSSTIVSFLPSLNENRLEVNHSDKLITNNSIPLLLQPDPVLSEGKLSSAVFKSQDYCRAELKDFEFDAQFSILSATVYFTGANFKNVETGSINSSSLKPIKNLMSRCQPGTIVIFDNIKVKGPDNIIRTIGGVTYRLF